MSKRRAGKQNFTQVMSDLSEETNKILHYGEMIT